MVLVNIDPATLVLPSGGDYKLDSDIDAQSMSGYEESSDADSISPGSPGIYVPTHQRRGQPCLLLRSRSEQSLSRSES